MMKMRILMIVCVIFFALQSNAQLTTIYKGLRHPESVISDGKYLYVSEIGDSLNPSEKDGDGAIVKLTIDGKLIDKHFCKSVLNSPKGSAIIKNVLYVADIDRIVAINLKNGEMLTEIDFAKYHTNFLNDICVKDNHTLLVTASDINKVFEVELNSNSINQLNIPDITSANGIFYDTKTKRAYINGLGAMDAKTGNGIVGYIVWENGKPQFHQYKNIEGFFDGMIVLNSGNIIVTDWVSLSKREGILKEINAKNGSSKILPLRKIFGPADIFYDKQHNRIYIPAAMEGSILKIVL